MMDDRKSFLLFLLILAIYFIVAYLPNKYPNVAEGFSASLGAKKTNENHSKLVVPKIKDCFNGSSCTKIIGENGSELFVSNIEDIPRDYQNAAESCNLKKMKLPTREEAWTIWINSTNCQKAFSANSNVIKDKATFIKSCHTDQTNCSEKAKAVNYSCAPEPKLTFGDDTMYRYGNYWLEDRYDVNGHYTLSYVAGITNAYMDGAELGTRCVARKAK